MAKTKPSWPQVTGPLAQHAEGFRIELSGLGYTPLTAAAHMRLMAHLSRWLAAEGLETSALTSSTAEAYFAERRSVGYVNERTVGALRPLLDYLRRVGAAPIADAAIPASATEQLLTRYKSYLTAERGLAATTAELNVRLVRPLLFEHTDEQESRIELKELTARHCCIRGRTVRGSDPGRSSAS